MAWSSLAVCDLQLWACCTLQPMVHPGLWLDLQFWAPALPFGRTHCRLSRAPHVCLLASMHWWAAGWDSRPIKPDTWRQHIMSAGSMA